MNYLELGQALARESGSSNVVLVTMQNQINEPYRLIQWINTAWNEVQTLHDDWEWMRSSEMLGGGVSFAPPAGASFAPLGTGPGTIGLDPLLFGGKWVKDSFRNHTTSAGKRSEIFMTEVSYDWWRDAYMYGANRSVQTRPVVLAIGPNKEICIGPATNGNYTITGDYYSAPTKMSADADVPLLLPVQYHMVIVYKALIYYGKYEAAPDVVERGTDSYLELLSQMERQYGPRIRTAAALA